MLHNGSSNFLSVLSIVIFFFFLWLCNIIYLNYNSEMKFLIGINMLRHYIQLKCILNLTYFYRWWFAKFIKQYVSTTINAVVWGSWSNWRLIIFAWYNEVNIKQKYVIIIFWKLIFHLDLVKQDPHPPILQLLYILIPAALQIQTVVVIEQLALIVLLLPQIVLPLDLQVTTEI